MARRLLVALLAVTTACSQRSPWVAAPSPESPRRTSTATRQQGETPAVALATVVPAAPAPADATVVSLLGGFVFPVPGVDTQRVADSFDDPRDGGRRRHQAIDIMAPRGTPVLSVREGRVLRLSRSAKGGITVYATDPDERFVFYYAHLDRYHDGLYAGRSLQRGDTLGYVGTSGNAPDHVPHLHFQLMRMPADRRYWNGEPINPFPLLRATGLSAAGQ